MQTWFLLMVFILAGAHGGGVTKTDEDVYQSPLLDDINFSNNAPTRSRTRVAAKNVLSISARMSVLRERNILSQNGVSQLWSENFKELEHLYGKTSDRDLYGAKLPPTVTFDAATTKLKGEALKKTEQFLVSDLTQARPMYPYNHNYNDMSNNQFKKLERPSTTYISYSNFKQISQTEAPNTYNYLKHLGQREKHNTDYPNQSSGGFEPYFSYVGRNPQESDAYRSIQDILYTSEANKMRESGSEENSVENKIHVTNKDRSKVRQLKGNALISHLKCRAGVCRKKITDSHRLHAKPTIKKIKRIVYSY